MPRLLIEAVALAVSMPEVARICTGREISLLGVSGLALLERQRPSGDRRALLLSREQIGDTLGVAQQTVNRDLALNTKMSNDDPPEGRG